MISQEQSREHLNITESCDMKQKYVSVCSSSSRFGRGQASTDPIIYDEAVCKEEMNLVQDCLLDDSGENGHLYVISLDNLNDAKQALSIVNGNEFVSPECAAEVKPFLCLYFFGLSDTSNGVVFQPSTSHCKNLRDDVCKLEWYLAQQIIRLPDCDTQFPSDTVPCDEDQGKNYILSCYRSLSSNHAIPQHSAIVN